MDRAPSCADRAAPARVDLRVLKPRDGGAERYQYTLELDVTRLAKRRPPPARRAVRGRLRRDARRAGVSVRELLAAREAEALLRPAGTLPRFDVAATRSGRTSSARPNIQNVRRTT